MRRLTLLLCTIALVGCSQAPSADGNTNASASGASMSSTTQTASADALVARTYADAAGAFTLTVPGGWATVENDGMITEAYEASGTSLVYADPTPTTLSEAKLHMAVLPACPTLSSSITRSEIIGGTVFLRSTWQDAAAGNLYEGVTWIGTRSGKCYVFTGYLHSCNLGPDCAPGHTEPFDKQAILDAFESIVRSLTFPAAMSSAGTAK